MTGRLLIAGTHSSVGKTTVTVGLLAAFRRRGVAVAPFKAGPDYIDPGLHAVAAGVASRNLDAWLMDHKTLAQVFARGCGSARLAVVEGVMGLFDGIGSGQEGSTADVARTLQCPVILVVDVKAMSTTAAALVLGCQKMRPGVDLVGVILNRVGGDAHAANVAEAVTSVTGLPVLGSLPERPEVSVPERHLGLVPAREGGLSEEVVDRLASAVEERFDLPALERLAAAAPPLAGGEMQARSPGSPFHDVGHGLSRVRIAVAQDRAFSFYYPDTLDILAACGAEVVPFSPLADGDLPGGTQGVYLGGGFPELYAEELANNDGMRAAIQRHAASGGPIYAECGGLMVLGETLTTFEGRALPMFGVLPTTSSMQRERLTIGYREVEALRASPLMEQGTRVRGHEFHWSVSAEPGEQQAAYRVLGENRLEGFSVGATLGSYVHLNLAGNDSLARRFVERSAGTVR